MEIQAGNPLRSHKGLLDKDASYPLQCCHKYEYTRKNHFYGKIICNAYFTLFCRADVLYIYFLVLLWLKKFAFGYRQNFIYKS